VLTDKPEILDKVYESLSLKKKEEETGD
jgi:hypothetical protein